MTHTTYLTLNRARNKLKDNNDLVLTAGGNSATHTFHTDPDCVQLDRIANTVVWEQRSIDSHYDECRHCTNEFEQVHCRTCGDTLDKDGECGFCQAMRLE